MIGPIERRNILFNQGQALTEGLPRKLPIKDIIHKATQNPYFATLILTGLTALAIKGTEVFVDYIREPLSKTPPPPGAALAKESLPTEHVIIEYNQGLPSNPESALSPLAQRILKDKKLQQFVNDLPEGISVAFRTMKRGAIVASEDGIYFRHLPSESVDQAPPYSRGHQEQFNYVGEIDIEQKSEDGTIHSERWAILLDGDYTKPLAYANIGSEIKDADGKLIPTSIKINLSTFGPESDDPLHMLRSKIDGRGR